MMKSLRATVIPIFLVLILGQVGIAHGSTSTEEIAALFTQDFHAFWINSDSAGLASLWTEDGEWMNMVGSRRVVSGRQAIAEVWDVGLAGRENADQLRLEVKLERVLPLGSDWFQVDVLLTFGTETSGLMREAMVAVAARTPEGWKIRTARVARLPAL